MYTVREFAALCEVSPQTIYDWVNSGDLDHVRMNGRIRIPARVVTSFKGTAA